MAETYLSMNEYDTNGTQTEFEISFAGGYLSQDHVSAGIGDGKDDNGDLINQEAVSFTWVGPNQISIVPAPAAGKLLRIYRQTPFDAPLTDFTDSAVIDEAGLDRNAKQAVFLAAELRDRIGTIPGWDAVLQAISEAADANALMAALLEELELSGLAKVYGTWAMLDAIVGSPGATALVVIQDGTHTDPVSGLTVDNAGFYRWNTTPAAWTRFADTQASIATTAANDALGYATALAVATAGGWYESLAEGAADPAVAEGDGYFYLTSGRFYIGKKVGGVGVQQAEFLTSASALDAILSPALTAFATLTPASDRLPYYNGASTAALTPFTGEARNLMACATKADMRGILELIVGTHVQAYDSDLAAIAGVGTASFGRSLLALADAASLRTAAGIVVTGDASSGKITVGDFALTWRQHTIANNTTASYGYGGAHTYTTFARAWIEGDDGNGDRSYTVVASGLSSASVRSNGNVSGTGVLFSIGV